MSFCRITGKARGLPKPNYFPLLPPISPADAKRFCRITTKSQGLPGHHFIPALLGAKAQRAHCRVTGKSEGQAPHHFPNVDSVLKAHEILPGYKYVFPKFDEGKKQQLQILQLMSTKTLPGESNARFVYAVDERRTGLVIPAELEAAVRDGDVRDLMLDKDKDTMLVKLHRGPSVTIDVSNLVVDDGLFTLWDGLGPSQAVLKQREKEERETREKRRKKRNEGLGQRTRLFEDKERAAEEEELEMERIKDARKSKMVRVTMRGGAEDVELLVDHGPPAPQDYLADAGDEPVFGHIVQTAKAVEFFPGDTILELPEGKVVPGRLLRNADGVKFVPGIMADGRFVPGQLVVTDSGEQFVPGQVVDTRDGPKFVPGQVAETTSGPKFVPGQTIETEDGPQFVPGQIIETKAGPTFIPGQIIYTDEEPRFVPGRVVETAEGPRFVPGRVIESGNQVTFVSGQVVETSEGLRFVAPDLEYVPEGGHEFSVQGFEVSPEELKFLRPTAGCSPASCGVVPIDSKMLRQLSEAGMSVGRHVPTKLPEVDIRPLPVVIEKLNLSGAQALKMSQVVTVLSQVALKISQRSDLCASEIDIEDDAGDKILCAARKNKDLGKYLQAIVASSVVAARNRIDEGSVASAVSSALETVLSARYESAVTKEALLAVIGNAVDDENVEKDRFLSDIRTAIEREMQLRAEKAVSKEGVLRTLNGVLETELGRENSTQAKAAVFEAVKSAIERKEAEMRSKSLAKDAVMAMLSSAMESEMAKDGASDSPSKEALLAAVNAEMEKERKPGEEWAFSEESFLAVVKAAVEREVSQKGATLTNGSLSSAIAAGLKKEFALRAERSLTEEQLLGCIASVAEKDLPVEVAEKVTGKRLLSAVATALEAEKAPSEEALAKSAFAALEKTLSVAPWRESLDGDKFLEAAAAKIEEEIAAKRENAETKKILLGNLEKAVERKLSETCRSAVSEEVVVAALNSAIESEVGADALLSKEKMSRVVASAFKDEKRSVASKARIMEVLREAVEGEGIFASSHANETVFRALNEAIEEKRRAKYESGITEDEVLSAVESAMRAAEEKDVGITASRGKLLTAISAELKKARAKGIATEGRIIAAVHSILREELADKPAVQAFLAESFDSAMEERQAKKRNSLLTEEELLSTLDSAIEIQLSRNPECKLTKDCLMTSVYSAIVERKLKRRESILSERALLECVHAAFEREVAALGVESDVVDSLLGYVCSAVEKEKEAAEARAINEETVLKAVNSAMDSELVQNNKISVTKEALVRLVNEAIQEERGDGGEALTEDKLLKIVEATLERKTATEEEAHLLMKAFGSAVEEEKSVARKRPVAERTIVEIIASAAEASDTGLTREKVLSAFSATLDEEMSKRGDRLSEENLIAIAYDEIEKELAEKGESPSVKENLLSGIDSVVEKKREERRIVDNEILLDAVKAIAGGLDADAVKAVADLAARETLTPDAVRGVVAEHVPNRRKEEFLSALSAAVDEEQKARRGSILTKELLSAAVASAVEEQASKDAGLAAAKERLLSAADSAVESECSGERNLSEKELLESIGSSIEKVFGELSRTTPLDGVVNSMQRYLSENLDEVIVGTVNHMVANETAADKLRYAVGRSSRLDPQVVDKLSSVLDDNMGEAFQRLSARDPSLAESVLRLIDVANVSTKEEATEALQKAIVGAVRQKSANALRRIMSGDGSDLKELLLQSVALAKALGMNQVAAVLLDVVSDSTSHEVLARDETVVDILHRLTIMRQFAETKPELATALRQLISDPELAKRDPHLRELVRHSTALVTVPEEMLRSSADIPASLLLADDALAVEEFLARSRRPRTLLIIKSGLQAVVPKEASRAVLTGQLPYAVLDEKGIKYFEPLHVFSTMKLRYFAAHCFSMYRCPEAEDGELPPAFSSSSSSATPRGSLSSVEDFCVRGDRKRSFANARAAYPPPACRRATTNRSRGHADAVRFRDATRQYCYTQGCL